MRKAALLAFVAPMSLSAYAAPAMAQAAPAAPQAAAEAPGGLEEIVVTARKRSESLITVPVAVTALSAQDIARYNTSNITQLTQLTPQLVITTAGSGSGASLSIRGIGSVSEDPGLDQSVGLYFDNVGIGRGRIIGMSMFDVAQVEVLKGPQALFFGKNSPAGVVSITTAGPGRQLEGKVMAGYEFKARERYVEAAVGGPITDTFGARVAIRGEQSDGFTRNIAAPVFDPLTGVTAPGGLDKREPATKKIAGRLTLKYEPTSDFNMVGKFFYGHTRNNDPAQTIERFCAPGVAPSVAGVPDPATPECRLDRKVTYTDVNPALLSGWGRTNGGKRYGNTNALISSVAANYQAGPLALTSVTSYSKLLYHDFLNASQSSYEALIVQSNENWKQFTQEVRLNSDYDGPLNFTLGGYYEHSSRAASQIVALLFVGPDRGKPYNFDRRANNKTDTISGFGQLRWSILHNVELAGGVRYTRDKKKVNIGNAFVNANAIGAFGPGFFLDEGEFIKGRYRHSNWSPEATLTWHPTRSQTVYAAYKTGYKSGGFSNPALLSGGFNVDNLAYAPEKTKGGEIGYKAELLNRTLRVELSAYSYKYSNLQLSTFNAATFSYFIQNAASARTKGAELSVQWQATDRLNLRGDLAYNRGRFLDFPGAPCYQGQTFGQGCTVGLPSNSPADTTGGAAQNEKGQALPRAPKIVYTGGFTYEQPLGGGLSVSFDGDTRYSSSYFIDTSLAPLIKQKNYWLWDAGIRLHPDDKRWELAFLGRNLSNKIYANNATDTALEPVGVWAVQVERGRQLAIQGTWNF